MTWMTHVSINAKHSPRHRSSHVSRTSADEQSLRRRMASLDSEIRRLRSGVEVEVGEGKSLDNRAAEKLEEDLQRARTVMADGDASRLSLKARISRHFGCGETFRGATDRPECHADGFLRMFLGPINVRASKKDIQLRVKEEYNEYKRGVELFLQWAIMQGVAMLLQNRYQHQRLYTRIALGKTKRMDVVWGEAAGVDGQLWLLCPIIFAVQGFEDYVGAFIAQNSNGRSDTRMAGTFLDSSSSWGNSVVVCGILLVLMAVGNFTNTVQTLMAKSRFKAKMKRTKSKHGLD